MPSRDAAIGRDFRRFVRSVDALDDPVGVAIAIDREIAPGVDPVAVRTRVESLGEALASRTNALPAPLERVTQLGRFLGNEHGYVGNADDYGNPDNALLSRVLETRRGLPITLSVLYLGVARVAGIPLVGVGLPGHFLVGQLALSPPAFIDPFRNGKQLDRDECDRIVRAVTGTTTATADAYMRPVPPRALLTRILNNLQMAHWQRREYGRALHVARLLCVVNPTSSDALRGRAFIYDRLGRYEEAVVDYESYLRRAPKNDETARIDRRVVYLKRRMRGRSDTGR